MDIAQDIPLLAGDLTQQMFLHRPLKTQLPGELAVRAARAFSKAHIPWCLWVIFFYPEPLHLKGLY